MYRNAHFFIILTLLLTNIYGSWDKESYGRDSASSSASDDGSVGDAKGIRHYDNIRACMPSKSRFDANADQLQLVLAQFLAHAEDIKAALLYLSEGKNSFEIMESSALRVDEIDEDIQAKKELLERAPQTARLMRLGRPSADKVLQDIAKLQDEKAFLQKLAKVSANIKTLTLIPEALLRDLREDSVTISRISGELETISQNLVNFIWLLSARDKSLSLPLDIKATLVASVEMLRDIFQVSLLFRDTLLNFQAPKSSETLCTLENMSNWVRGLG